LNGFLRKYLNFGLLNNFFFFVAIKNKCLILFMTEKYNHFEAAYKEKKMEVGDGGG
jgi:hypothetical protein